MLVSRCGSASTRPSGVVIVVRAGRPRSDSQSSSRMISSCDTSTNRRVRYPESAVRSAVSARPLRAPWVEMKYSRTDRPSRKFDLIGRGMISPRGFATRPRIPAICWTCITLPRAPEPTIRSNGLNLAWRVSACMRVALHQHGGELGEVTLLHRLVVQREGGRERLVEEEAAQRALDEDGGIPVVAAASQHDGVGVLVVT